MISSFKADILPCLLLQSSCALDTVRCSSNSTLTFLSNQLFLWLRWYTSQKLGNDTDFCLHYPATCSWLSGLTDLPFKTSPLLRTLCSCYCPASFTCLTQPAKVSDSPLVWSSCHHQKCGFSTLLLCLKSFPDLLVPSGYLFFPKVPNLFYLRTTCHTLVSGTSYPTPSVCLHFRCPTFLSLTP